MTVKAPSKIVTKAKDLAREIRYTVEDCGVPKERELDLWYTISRDWDLNMYRSDGRWSCILYPVEGGVTDTSGMGHML